MLVNNNHVPIQYGFSFSLTTTELNIQYEEEPNHIRCRTYHFMEIHQSIRGAYHLFYCIDPGGQTKELNNSPVKMVIEYIRIRA